MTPADATRIAAIQAREQAATAGPWQTRFMYRLWMFARSSVQLAFNTPETQDWHDADFCAEARSDIPYLLAALARLQAENSDLKEQRASLHSQLSFADLRAAGGLSEAQIHTETLSLHRCKVCGTAWLLWPDSVHGGGWNLLDKYQRPGACCDNAAMGDQIEHLRDLPLQLKDEAQVARLQADRDIWHAAAEKYALRVAREHGEVDRLQAERDELSKDLLVAQLDLAKLRQELRTLQSNYEWMRHAKEAAEAARDEAQRLTAALRAALKVVRKEAHRVAANNGWGEGHAANLASHIRATADAALAALAAGTETP